MKIAPVKFLSLGSRTPQKSRNYPYDFRPRYPVHIWCLETKPAEEGDLYEPSFFAGFVSFSRRPSTSGMARQSLEKQIANIL